MRKKLHLITRKLNLDDKKTKFSHEMGISVLAAILALEYKQYLLFVE